MSSTADDREVSTAGHSTGGRLVYSIGDVHGQLDLLDALVCELLGDALASAPSERPMVILLGDYIDRGPHSAGVLDYIGRLKANPALEVRALKGNHEDAVLTFLGDPLFGPTWVKFGGAATLASYGVETPAPGAPPSTWVEARDRLSAALPPSHLALLDSLELMIWVGDYAFAHAGVRPTEALDRQTEQDLLWIRTEFLDWPEPLAKMIVHGHTPAAEPCVTSHRLGIDTGAYATGVLTAVRLQDGSREFIQARGAAGPAAARPLNA